MIYRLLVHVLLSLFLMAAAPTLFAAGKARHFVLVVWDGMRPDFVTPELTPTLHALRGEGVWFANHHSVYPTATKINGAALATGAFPQRNGISGNTEYRPDINRLNPIAMDSLRAVRRGDELTDGKYIAVPTLPEILQEHGFKTAVAGSKPVALLHDRRERDAGASNFVWFADGCLPESKRAELTDRLGAFPPATTPNERRDEWTRRSLTEVFWEKEIPRYSVLWLSEPDATQHRHGVNSSEALEAIRSSDRQLAELLRELERRGVREHTDIVVASDHGFSTIGDNVNVTSALREAGINAQSRWQEEPSDGDVTVVGTGSSVFIYVRGHLRNVVEAVVTNLQKQPFTGVVFTRDGLPGTFPLTEARIATANAPDMVVGLRWTTQPHDDSHPVVHVTQHGNARGGMHGTLSSLDLRNIAVAAGPDFRRGVTNPLPTGNVDIVPTFLWLMGIESPSPLDGRVMSEALSIEGPALRSTELGRLEARAELPGGVWEQYLKFTEINGVRYLDEGNGRWIARETD